MAYTQLTDLFVPRPMADAIFQASTEANRLIASGAVVNSPVISGLLAGGGLVFDFPSFVNTDASDDEAFVPTDDESDLIVPEKVSQEKQVAIRLMRNKSWSTARLAAQLSATDPMGAVAAMAGGALNKIRQKSLIATIAGCINETRVSTLVNSIAAEETGNVAAGTSFSTGALIDTTAGWGDAIDNTGATLFMHSDVYRSLQKANLIVYLPTNTQDIGFGTYLGFTVVVDDRYGKRAGTTSGFVYTIAIARPGAIGFGAAPVANPVALVTNEKAGYGAGVEELIVRDQFAYHVNGFAWDGAVNVLPSDADLADASNWATVLSPKQIGISALVCNLPA